jgi:DNA-binding response OmpR family regulator
MAHPPQTLCLVVESDAAAAFSLAETLTERGYFVAGPLTSNADALDWLGRFRPDAAIVAATLRDGRTDDLVRELSQQGVPLVIYSAGDPPLDLVALAGVNWVEKTGALGEVLASLVRLLL